ncbi:hypothetical protein AB0M68_37210 [Streptomyces sp. NPDC051453]|uniref:hypothetical protein n=1 Tax=Streptomyces sp. NPDC051453 TaxID=3154941 RepID=UPI00341EA5BF
MEGWQFWWGIAAFFLGGLATQLNGWLTYRRQRKDKADDAADALRQRREEFELQHLVDFNGLLVDAMEKVLEYNGAVGAYNALRALDALDDETEQWRERAEEASQAALGSVAMQVGFILADGVRDTATDAIDHLARVNAQLHANNDISVGELASASEALHDGLGARVRAIYGGRAARS